MSDRHELTERQQVRLTLDQKTEFRALCRAIGVPPGVIMRHLALGWIAQRKSRANDWEVLAGHILEAIRGRENHAVLEPLATLIPWIRTYSKTPTTKGEPTNGSSS